MQGKAGKRPGGAFGWKEETRGLYGRILSDL